MGHYLFLLATAKFPVCTERLLGMRQLVTIGAEAPPSESKIGWRIRRKPKSKKR